MPTSVFLGRACVTDVDCGERLRCLTTADNDVGPAGGYCTIPCETDAGCADFEVGAMCQRVVGDRRHCVLPCDFGPAELGEKCHGRRDVACVATDVGSGPACLPRCNDDSQCCPDGESCERRCQPATGLCGLDIPTGEPSGTPCSGPMDASCRGSCVAIGDGPDRYVCADLCTFGSFPACGWRPSAGPAPAYCHFAVPRVERLGRAAGDAGWCAALCDCDDDCQAPLACQPFADERDASATHRVGVCTWTESALVCEGAAGAGGVGAQPTGYAGSLAWGGDSFGGRSGGPGGRSDAGFGGRSDAGPGGRSAAGSAGLSARRDGGVAGESRNLAAAGGADGGAKSLAGHAGH